MEKKDLQRFLSHSIPAAQPVTNGENSKIHGFPVEPYFAQVVSEPEKRSGFSHSLLIVQVPNKSTWLRKVRDIMKELSRSFILGSSSEVFITLFEIL